ncbi:unnamed protein product [Urochloa humidicola]
MRELHLRSNQLSGSIPSSLFELPCLEYLDLSENLFQGHIPMSSFADISSALRTLKLSGNNLSGAFHFLWLRNCTMLENIDLSGNRDLYIDVKFHGRLVPPFQLRSLVLSGCNVDNSILVGPNFLGTQRHLEMLDLSHNNLTGSIPGWICTNVATLVYLNIASNSLVGSIDPMWQHRSALQMMNVSNNHFVGQLPANISSVFPDLEVLVASNNIISGYLPPSLCNMGNIRVVDLSNNKFIGEVPTCFFTDFPSLDILKLSNNNLGGSIFGGVTDLSIAAIYLGGNKFEGTLPSNLSEFQVHYHLALVISPSDTMQMTLIFRPCSTFLPSQRYFLLWIMMIQLSSMTHFMTCKVSPFQPKGIFTHTVVTFLI